MSGTEDSFGWCSDHSQKEGMSDSDDNDFMTHPEVDSRSIKKEKIEQFLSLEDNSLQSTSEKKKRKVKSVVTIANDVNGEVQYFDNSTNNELFTKKKHKKKIKDPERKYDDENGIKLERETNGEKNSRSIKNNYYQDNLEIDVMNEESSRKKKKKKTEIALTEDEIHSSDEGIKFEFPPKKKKEKHLDSKERIPVENRNLTEDFNTNSLKNSKKKRKNIEKKYDEPMTTDENFPKDSFHYENSNDNDYKTPEHKSIQNYIETDDEIEIESTIIKQESTKKKITNNSEPKIQTAQDSNNKLSDFSNNDANISKEKPTKKIKRERNISTSSDTSNTAKQQEEKQERNRNINNLSEYSSNPTVISKSNENNRSLSDDDSSIHDSKHTIAADGKGQKRRKSVSKVNQLEDDDSETALVSDQGSINSENNNYSKFSKVLKYYKTFKIDKQLFDPKLQINPNHDLFLLKCPRNLDISQLVGVSLAMDGRSKIKIENNTYECILENNEKNHCTIISPTKKSGKYSLQSIKTQGEMRLRRKLPKPNVANDMVAVKHHTFMQLPDTKRRHPLFGIEYKPMIKITKQVAERLQEAQTLASNLITKQKKRVKPELTDLDISIKKKKKRKRKASDSESVSEVSIKKVKQDPGQSEKIWDSEKHIAQSLFADL